MIVYGDGIDRCKPLLIFHGKPKGDSRRIAERRSYNTGVVVEFNEAAWANEENIIRWIKHQYRHASDYIQRDKEPRLHALDSFTAHITPEVQQAFRDINCTTSIIPGGCTGFVQVLDVGLNKPLKDLVKEQSEMHYDENFDEWKANKYSTADRRILLTH